MADAPLPPDAASDGKHDSTGRFDAYPDHERPFRVGLLMVEFTPEGTPTGEWELVDLDGLSFREVRPGLRFETGRRRLAARTTQAHDRLVARIGPIDLDKFR